MISAPAQNPASNRLAQRALQWAAATSLTVGIVVLVGWALDITVIKCVVPGLLPMKANAALGFVLLGTALFCQQSRQPWRRVVLYLCATILLALSVATLAEHAFFLDLGIDQMLFLDPEQQPSRFFQPGRMSPIAAISFSLLITAVLLSGSSSRRARWSERICIVAPLLVAARSLVAYVYGVPMIFGMGQYSSMALHVIVTFAVVSLALLLSRQDSRLVSLLLDNSGVGSKLARRVGLWAIGLPVGLGLLCLQGERIGLYPSAVGVTIFVVLMAVMIMVFLMVWSRWINQLDHLSQRAAEAAQTFREASERDVLTGMFNRRGFQDRCEQELARTRRARSPLSCLVFDIDFFKKINDLHGHGAGDEVLRQFAAILKSGCRPCDIIGRVGGEEFCILLPDTNEQGAQILAQRLQTILANKRIEVGEAELAVTASGGIAELHAQHVSIGSLMDSADAALLVAKQTGRNKHVTASSLAEVELDQACCGPLGKLQACDIMTPLLTHVRLDDTASESAKMLMELSLDSLPVVDAAGKLAGFVTEQDLITTMLDPDSANRRIANCTRFSVAAFEETTGAEEIAQFFSRTAAQRVVIVRQGLPVGVVSRRTLLRWLLNYSLQHQPAQGTASVGSAETALGGIQRSIHDLMAGAARLASLDDISSPEQSRSTIVAEATRIQESVENLLTSCRDRRPQRAMAEFLTAGAASIG